VPWRPCLRRSERFFETAVAPLPDQRRQVVSRCDRNGRWRSRNARRATRYHQREREHDGRGAASPAQQGRASEAEARESMDSRPERATPRQELLVPRGASYQASKAHASSVPALRGPRSAARN
jgi:hypothetical protein